MRKFYVYVYITLSFSPKEVAIAEVTSIIILASNYSDALPSLKCLPCSEA